jgi:hypothetical protein
MPRGPPERVQLLLDHHADPEKDSSHSTIAKSLHCCAYGDDVAAMRAVLQHGAKVNPVISIGCNWGRDRFYRPLHESAQRSTEAVSVVLEFGADVKKKDMNFKTPLYLAA